MPDSYGEVHARMQRELAEARLADPDEHFPYKTGDARTALADTSMGPDGDAQHDVTGADFLSRRIIDASEAYIDAQAAYLADPAPANRGALDAATDDLVAARRSHRRNRVDSTGKPVAGIVGVTDATLPDHHRGSRLRRVGEE